MYHDVVTPPHIMALELTLISGVAVSACFSEYCIKAAME